MDAFKNTLLQHLPGDVIERLQLRKIKLPVGKELHGVGRPIDRIFFLESGIGSMTACFSDGSQVEVTMFGYESAIGVSALIGARRSINRTFMQLEGAGYTCPIRTAIAEFERREIFHSLSLRYVQAQLTLSMQNAACNALHTYEQRLARWLLICSDRAHTSTLHLAQEYVSEMLGSTRSTVSIAAGHLKQKGLIDYSRGIIHILDAKGLEDEACECYRVVRNHLENMLEFDTGYIT